MGCAGVGDRRKPVHPQQVKRSVDPGKDRAEQEMVGRRWDLVLELTRVGGGLNEIRFPQAQVLNT